MFYLIGVIWFIQILMYAKRKYTLMYRAWSHGEIVYMDPDSVPCENDTCRVNSQNKQEFNGYSQHSQKLKTT